MPVSQNSDSEDLQLYQSVLIHSVDRSSALHASESCAIAALPRSCPSVTRAPLHVLDLYGLRVRHKEQGNTCPLH